MRSQTVTLVNIQLPKGKRVKPKELYKFPWDITQKAGPQLTKAEAKAILAKWQKRAT
jgi:hypothetical protein